MALCMLSHVQPHFLFTSFSLYFSSGGILSVSFPQFLFSLSFFNVFVYLFILGCSGSLLICAGFSSCGELGLLFVVVPGLLTVVASLVAEHGL